MIDEYFQKDLQNELEIMVEDIDNETGIDSIDLKVWEDYWKKMQLCEVNHINILKKNQKYCDRPNCKKPLIDRQSPKQPAAQMPSNCNSELSNAELRSPFNKNVPEVENEHQAEECPVRAYQVNPNTDERIQEVLDNILENAGLKDS